MILAVLQARVSSRRLPGKVLRPILGQPMIARQMERIRRARTLDGLVLATSSDASDDPLQALGAQLGVEVHRGALEDVLDRFHSAAAPRRPAHVVRLTGDCPLIDPRIVDRVVEEHLEQGSDYCSNAVVRTYPDGLDVEIMRFEALESAWNEARLPSEREHVTPFLYKRPERFRLHAVTREPDLSALRWVVDREEDLEIVRAVFERLYDSDPGFGMEEVLALARSEPQIFAGNAAFAMDEGWKVSLEDDAAFLERERKR